MRAVLLESNKPGMSARAAVRGSRMIQVRGLADGDILILHYFNGEKCFQSTTVEFDCDISIVARTTHICAEHRKVSGGKNRVSVDMI